MSLNKHFNLLKSHSRYFELIDMRKNALAKDSIYQNRLVSSRYIDSYNNVFSGANYEYNYNFDFELSKNDVRDLKNSRLTERLLEKLENDLGMLDNNPIYVIEQKEPIFDDVLDYTDNISFDVFDMFPALYEDVKMLSKGHMILFLCFVLTVLKTKIIDSINRLFYSISLLSLFLEWINRIKPKKLIVG